MIMVGNVDVSWLVWGIIIWITTATLLGIVVGKWMRRCRIAAERQEKEDERLMQAVMPVLDHMYVHTRHIHGDAPLDAWRRDCMNDLTHYSERLIKRGALPTVQHSTPAMAALRAATAVGRLPMDDMDMYRLNEDVRADIHILLQTLGLTVSVNLAVAP